MALHQNDFSPHYCIITQVSDLGQSWSSYFHVCSERCGQTQTAFTYKIIFEFLYAHRRQVLLCLALCPSICPSICPSVNFLCPLRNSDTIEDIFMKLGTNIKHHQTMCREQESTLHLHFLRNCGPLKLFL